MIHQEFQIEGQPAMNKYHQLLYAEGDAKEEIGIPVDVSTEQKIWKAAPS